MKSNILTVLCLATMAMAIPAIQGAQPGSDDAPGASPAANRLNFRRFPNDPPPCTPRRPCSGRPSGGNDTRNQGNGGNDTHQQGNGGDPVVVVGGTTWPYNPTQQSGDDGPPNPHHNDTPTNTPASLTAPNNFAPTPEPTYVALTGLAFGCLALFAGKRRRSRD